jgi:hypothetical protein
MRFVGTYKSKLSFQYGLRVLLDTVVVFVCSPLIVATAKGSGNPGEDGQRLDQSNQQSSKPGAPTKHIPLVEAVGGNDLQ